MTKHGKKFKQAKFMPGRGVGYHGGMKPLPKPKATKDNIPVPAPAQKEDVHDL